MVAHGTGVSAYCPPSIGSSSNEIANHTSGGIAGWCADKSSVTVTRVSLPVPVRRLSKQPSVAVGSSPPGKTIAEASIQLGGGPEEVSIALDAEADASERAAVAALEQLNECIESISPELKRRLAETADVAEPISIQGWGQRLPRSTTLFAHLSIGTLS